MTNEYIPFLSKIKEIVKHTETEYTFRMTYVGEVRPGQFFEVSIPKYGEAPISVSGIGEDYVDLTIRKVGKVTGEIFELNEESSFFMRGPYGNGFEKENYQGKELIVVAVKCLAGIFDQCMKKYMCNLFQRIFYKRRLGNLTFGCQIHIIFI